MTEDEADRVDWLEREATTPRPGELGVAPADICAFWTDAQAQVPPEQRGLSEYVQRRRALECAEADQAEKRAQEDEARKEKERAAMVALTAEEVRAGACDTGHREALEKFAFKVKDGLKFRMDRDGRPHVLTLLDQQILLATPEPKVFQHASVWGGELHLMAFGTMPVALEVQRDGQPVTLKSPWEISPTAVTLFDGTMQFRGMNLEHPLFPPFQSVAVDSRVVEIRSGEQLGIGVTGQGCVLLMAFLGS